MCEEKRNNDRPAEGGTLNSGRLMAPDVGEIYLQRPNDFQPIEGVAKSHQESDLPIVVRDGNTDHTAKDQAGMQRGQSTHARGRKTLDESVSRTLSALGTKAEKAPEHRFRSLALFGPLPGKFFGDRVDFRMLRTENEDAPQVQEGKHVSCTDAICIPQRLRDRHPTSLRNL